MISSLHQSLHKFPSNNHNDFHLLQDSEVFFPEMLKAINTSQNYIFLEMYLISSGTVTTKFLNALSQAASRGVKIFIILDDFGARELIDKDRLFMQQHKFQVTFYNPVNKNNHKLSLFRDHRKLLLIDNRVAFIGGAGLSDKFITHKSDNTQYHWRDNMLKIEGGNVYHWFQLFSQNWQRWSYIKLPIFSAVEITGKQKGKVVINSGPGRMEIKRSFINRTRKAKQRLWLCTPYFAPTRKLLKTIKKISKSGVDVKILCPGPIIDHPMVRYLAQSHYSTLLKSGVEIYEYQPRFLHAKIVLCDQWVSMGSCNLDRWNFLWNLDANQEIENNDFSQSIENMLLNDISNSKKILLKDWKNRSFMKRLKISLYAKFFSFVDSFLSRLRILKYWKTILKEHKKTAN